MASDQLKQQIADTRKALFDEGLLDELFVQLEGVTTADNPNFLEEIFEIFFSDSPKYIVAVEEILQKPVTDYSNLERNLFKLKGSSASVGANKVHLEVIKILIMVQQRNLGGVAQGIKDLRRQYEILEHRLDPYFELLQQAREAENEQP